MEIRRLTPRDASDFRALRLRALQEHPQAFTSSWEEEREAPLDAVRLRLARDEMRFWGAFEQGALCGMVGLERETRAKNRHKGTVVAMYVATEQAGRGVGRALLDALIAEAKGAGLELLVLTVTEGSGSAARLYERCGFRSFGIEPRAIKVDGRAWAKNHMYLELTPS
jgi:GNAT superfamily N-acetyltransferase